MPVVGAIGLPLGSVAMTECRLQLMSAFRTDLRGGVGRFVAGSVSPHVFLCSARAFMPVVGAIGLPLGAVAVSARRGDHMAASRTCLRGCMCCSRAGRMILDLQRAVYVGNGVVIPCIRTVDGNGVVARRCHHSIGCQRGVRGQRFTIDQSFHGVGQLRLCFSDANALVLNGDHDCLLGDFYRYAVNGIIHLVVNDVSTRIGRGGNIFCPADLIQTVLYRTVTYGTRRDQLLC